MVYLDIIYRGRSISMLEVESHDSSATRYKQTVSYHRNVIEFFEALLIDNDKFIQ